MKLITQNGIERLDTLVGESESVIKTAFELNTLLYEPRVELRQDIDPKKFGKIYSTISEIESNTIHTSVVVRHAIDLDCVEINRFQKFVIEKILRIRL